LSISNTLKDRHRLLTWQSLYFIEILFVIFILSVLLNLALHYYSIAYAKSRMTQSFALVNVLKQEIVLSYAFSGTWPDTEQMRFFLDDKAESLDLLGVEIKNGSFKVPLNPGKSKASRRYLAFNRVESLDGRQATALWTCASTAQLLNTRIDAQFTSTLENDYSFSICK